MDDDLRPAIWAHLPDDLVWWALHAHAVPGYFVRDEGGGVWALHAAHIHHFFERCWWETDSVLRFHPFAILVIYEDDLDGLHHDAITDFIVGIAPENIVLHYVL